MDRGQVSKHPLHGSSAGFEPPVVYGKDIVTDEEDAQRWADEWESPEFKHGLDVGKSFGQYDTVTQAQAAFDAGEIELWLDWQRPKTIEEWALWEMKFGSQDEMEKRWKG